MDELVNVLVLETGNTIIENTFQTNYHFKSILLLLTPTDYEVELLPDHDGVEDNGDCH